MTRTVGTALLQLRAHDRSEFHHRRHAILEGIRLALARDARLIVLPEGTVPGYVLGPARPMTAELSEIAAFERDVLRLASDSGAVIVYGGLAYTDDEAADRLRSAAELSQTLPINAAIVVGPDGKIGAVGKRFLWHFDRHWFQAASNLSPLATPIGLLGIMVCADCRVPTIGATLAERGAECFVVPTAWVTSGRDLSTRENTIADLLAPVRALENRIPLVAANKVGVEARSVLYCGKSQAIDASGALIAKASDTDEEIVFAEIELGPRTLSFAVPLPLGSLADSESSLNDVVDGTRSVHESSFQGQSLRVGFCSRGDDELLAAAVWSNIDLLIVGELNIVSEPSREPSQDGIAEAITETAAGTNSESSALRHLGRRRYEYSGISSVGASTPHAMDVVSLADVEPGTTLHAGIVFADDRFRDPSALVDRRLGGGQCFVCRTSGEFGVTDIMVARARAVELRVYVMLCSTISLRAIAIDPDGTIIAGTTDQLELAQFTLEPSRTAATSLVPATDIREGLGMIARLRMSE